MTKEKAIKYLPIEELERRLSKTRLRDSEWWIIHAELKRKRAKADAYHLLELSEIEIKLARNREEKARLDLSSRGVEPLPNHHCINHEK